MFGRAIWDKLPECIFENYEIARVKRVQFQNFKKSRGLFIPKIAAISFNSGQFQNSRQLQNNTVNSALSITIHRVINSLYHTCGFFVSYSPGHSIPSIQR